MDPLTALPNYRALPTPHLVLDPPHEAFCLTPASPSRADAAELSRMVETPSIWKYFGMAASGFSAVDAEAKLRLWEEEDGQWGFPVIRRTADVQSQSSGSVPPAPWVGLFRVCRSFWAVSEKGKAILAKEQELPNEQAHYHTAWVMLDPEVGGNGLMTAVGRFIIDKWFIPKLHPYPGQLSSAWLSSNAASAKLHARLGFEPVAKNTNPAQGEVVYAVWQGAGPCGYDKSIWAGWTTPLESSEGSTTRPSTGERLRVAPGDPLLASFTHPGGPVENLALPPSVTSLATYRAEPVPHVVIFGLANDPSIAPNLGVTPENPMTLEVAEGLVRGNMVNTSAWPMWGPPPRRASDGRPHWHSAGHRLPALGPLAEAKVKEEASLPDDKAHYVMVLYVDPAYPRRGLMKAAVSHILDEWLRPRSFPSQLLSFFFPANTPSCAFHRSLNFLPVGISYDWVGMKPGTDRWLSPLVNDPLVSVGLATTKVGTFGLPEATKRVEATLQDPRGCNSPHGQLSLSDPGLVGNLALRPDRKLTLLGPYANEVLAQEADLPDERVHWAMAFSLDPAYFRHGIMT
ncbi:hypothetical protein EHS25_007960, partial [Saitozyma podzolica]